MGLARLLGQQAAVVGGCQQLLVDLVGVEDTGGNQVVEVAAGLPQLAVALALGGGGDPGQLRNKGCLRVPAWGPVGGWEGHDRGGRPVEPARLEELAQRCWHLRDGQLQIAAGQEPVGVARGVAAWGSDHIAAAAAPVHVLQVAGVDVAQASGSDVRVPAASTGADQRSRAGKAVLGGECPDGLGAGGAVDVQDVER
jgi:hypothetical protein